MNMLATLPDPATMQSVGWIVLTLAGLGGIAATILGVMNGWRDWQNKGEIGPQPFIVKHAEEYATKADVMSLNNESLNRRNESKEENRALRVEMTTFVTKVESEVKGITSKLSTDHHTISVENEARASRTHQRIDSVTTSLNAKIEAEAAALDSKIDTMPQKIIAILRDTGALRKS